MKRGIILSLIFLLSMNGDFAYAEGGDVGKGTDSTKIDREMAIYHDIYGYCHNAIAILKKYMRKAGRRSDMVQKRRILIEGVNEALASFPNFVDQPLTQSALERALELDASIGEGCTSVTDPKTKEKCINFEQRVAVNLVAGYLTHVETVVYPLDTNYYIPHYQCPRSTCFPDPWYNGFYVAYKDAAGSLLRFYIDASNTLGKDKYELQVAEKVFAWSAEDLEQDLFRRNFSCLVQDLLEVSVDLANFNIGDRDVYTNSTEAVISSRYIASENYAALNEIACGPYSPYP